MAREKHSIAPENRRDTASDKKKIKKAIIIVAIALAALAALLGVLTLVSELIKPEYQEISYDEFRFYEADYDKNIFDDDLYMRRNRDIHYNRYGTVSILTEYNAGEVSQSGKFFYDYFNCIINGEYEKYPEFFTEKYLKSDEINLPERFTMQGLYDINVTLHSVESRSVGGEDITVEIFEVSYRIFENNGTFRSDVLPDETRTIVFELYITDSGAKINAIGHRANG